MILPKEAEALICSLLSDFGEEKVFLERSAGRILRQEVRAERAMPPFDRVCMDGIAICFASLEKTSRRFSIRGVQAAGQSPLELSDPADCLEVMTGAVLPGGCDTVIRYEDLLIADDFAEIDPVIRVKCGQNIHKKGTDHPGGDLLLSSGCPIGPHEVAVLATEGISEPLVGRLPSITIVSTGSELVDLNIEPELHQIRRSNSYAISASLQSFGFTQTNSLHLVDDLELLRISLGKLISNRDVIILSGGVSKGKFDFVPQVLEEIGVKKAFYKICQRPGKPMWFGQSESGSLVFGLPGNPVSAITCLHRYVLPALMNACGLAPTPSPVILPLGEDFSFRPSLSLFLPCRLDSSGKQGLRAMPLPTNGSGDFSALTKTDGFVELCGETENFKAGTGVPFYPWRPLV